MKYLLLLLLLINANHCFSQLNKNVVYYKAEVITIDIIQNRFEATEKVINTKVFGTDVEIFVDTLFKKYTINFTDEDYKRSQIWFKFMRYYTPPKEENKEISKLYLMEFQENQFFLIDYLDLPLVNKLIISYEKPLANNCTLLYRVSNATRVYK